MLIFVSIVFVYRDSSKKKVTREITSLTSYLLGNDWTMWLDVLIQLTSPIEMPCLVAFVRYGTVSVLSTCITQYPLSS